MSGLWAAVTITWGIKYRNTPSHLQGTYSKNLQSNTSRVWHVQFLVKSMYSSNFGGFSDYTSIKFCNSEINRACWMSEDTECRRSICTILMIQTKAKLWVTFRTTINSRILSQKTLCTGKKTCFALTLCIFSSPLICPFAKHTSSFPGYEMKVCAKFSKFKFRRPSLLYPYPKLRPAKGSVLK